MDVLPSQTVYVKLVVEAIILIITNVKRILLDVNSTQMMVHAVNALIILQWQIIVLSNSSLDLDFVSNKRFHTLKSQTLHQSVRNKMPMDAYYVKKITILIKIKNVIPIKLGVYCISKGSVKNVQILEDSISIKKLESVRANINSMKLKTVTNIQLKMRD